MVVCFERVSMRMLLFLMFYFIINNNIYQQWGKYWTDWTEPRFEKK